ncbi:MAG: flagellar basal body-associated FliL family protein [Alphaproteobacteria bacterium]|nr:flagellar basal body-associated FliL family protein [Alphaproteobacteria bacterium]
MRGVLNMAEGQVNASLDVEDESEEEDEGGGLDAKKLILFAVIPLLIIGAGAGAYFMGVFDKGDETQQHAGADAHGGEKDKHGGDAHAGTAFLEIPDMIVNLSSSDGQPRYLRLKVQLELKDEMEKASVEKVMPRVVDQFQTYLRELRVRDLRGSAGIYRLQMELLSRVNAAAYPVEVQDVLFQEILIQ